MNKLIKILPLLATCVGLVGCQDEDFGFSKDEISYQKNLKEFAQNFEQAIGGKISPDQDWNMAVQITANYDLTDLPEGKYNIRIFSENPINENAMLLANYDVNSAEPGSIKFDAIKGRSQVYVYILSENKQVVDSRSLKLTSNEVELLTSKELQSRASTRASGIPQVGAAIDGNTKIYLNDDYIYPISNLDFGTVSGLTYGEVKGMFVGDDAVFKEEGENGLKYPDLIRDVTFTMKETGEFKMNLVWAITSNTDAFGYYYKDDADNYRLFRVFDNIQNEFSVGTTAPASGGDGSFGSASDEAVINSKIYKLAYVDSHNNVTYNIPAGTTIGFFIIPGGGSGNTYYQDYNVLYSQKKLNWKVSSTAGGAHNLQSTWSAYYKYNGKLYLGFEDWKEKRENDYNDIVFYIDAPVEEKDNASLDVTPETLTESLITDKHAAIWSIAFEDLGNTLDFDFNDVVLQFKHVAGENNVDVILAAAGGTLPATLQRNSSQIGKEVHAAFGVKTTVPVNVHATGGQEKTAIENFASVTVDGNNFSITDLSEFSLHVVYSSGDGDVETAANLPFGEAYTKDENATRAPQCLIIPGSWVWPDENNQVYEAYLDFTAWATGWTKNTSWSGVTEEKIKANWHKNNYTTTLLHADPHDYYTEEQIIPGYSEKVDVESGLVNYHIELNRIGAAKYYGGTLNLKITDWKTDFSSEEGYNKIVLKGLQSRQTFTLDIPTESELSEFTNTTIDGLRYKVTLSGSNESKVVDIVIDLSSAAAIQLLGNYGDAESLNTNNNKFDVSAYASTCSAWIVSNSKPNDYAGVLPDIDADDQNMYPYDIIVPTGDNITDCQQYIDAASASKIVLPNNLFEGGRRMKIHIEYGSTVSMSRGYGSSYMPDVPLTYGANSFTLTTAQVNAIYANNAGLTLGFALNGVDQTKFVRAMWVEYCGADANLAVPSSLSIEENETKTITASYEGNGRMTASVTEGESNLQIMSVDGKNIQVKGLTEGTVKILVTLAADGTNYDGDTKEINVTVTPQDNRLERNISVAYNPSTITSAGGSATIQMTGGDAEGVAFTYSLVDGGDYVTLNTSTGAVTAKADGTAHVRVQSDGTDEYKPFDETIEVKVKIYKGEEVSFTNGSNHKKVSVADVLKIKSEGTITFVMEYSPDQGHGAPQLFYVDSWDMSQKLDGSGNSVSVDASALSDKEFIYFAPNGWNGSQLSKIYVK